MILKPEFSQKRKQHDWYTVHSVNCFFKKHYEEVQNLITDLINHNDYKILIEVGSGMGIPLNVAIEKNPSLVGAIGCDLDPDMINHCKKEFNNKKLVFVQGDATNLSTNLNEKVPDLMKHDKRIVMMIGNTLNHLNDVQKLDILNQMALTAGKHGLVLLVNFNSHHFGKAVQHFYNMVPQWYNKINPGEFDFTTCTFSEPESGYSNKWFSKEETENYVYKSGWDVQTFREIDLGIAFIGRYLPKPHNDLNQTLSDDFSFESNSRKSSSRSLDIERNYFSVYDTESLKFYQNIRGNTELHIGIYNDLEKGTEIEQIRNASEKSFETLYEGTMKYLSPEMKTEGLRFIDLGSAYGDQAIKLVKKGAKFVSCVEISVFQNINCKKTVHNEGLELHISNPGERSYIDTGEPNESFHVVWSQDSFLHAKSNREIIKEASRILVDNGILCFTDILMSDDIDASKNLEPIFRMIQTDDQGSYDKYLKYASEYGLELMGHSDETKSLTTHYMHIQHLLKHKADELNLSKDYREKAAEGQKNWISKSKGGYLRYGIFFFRKTIKNIKPRDLGLST